MLSAYVSAAVLVAAFVFAWWRTRDTFHPVMVFAPALAFMYVYLPIRLDLEDGFRGFLTTDQVSFANQVNLLGIVAFLAGILYGTSRAPKAAAPQLTEPQRQRLFKVAIAFGVIGLLSYAAGILQVGGLQQAYGSAYGGGWSDSGYARDLVVLTLPALILINLLGGERAWRFWLPLTLFALPMTLQGLFGARRGPTFMTGAGAGVSHYMGRGRRPGIVILLAGGALLGLLMLFLVSNRRAIYIGSEEQLANSPDEVLRAGTGNEFIYGAGALFHYDVTGRFMNGGRYATILFVRPIPRALWPTKYTDAAEFFGTPNLETNLGNAPDDFEETLGWRGAYGAAPGLIADMFIEFGWLFPIAVFAAGFLMGLAWRRSTTAGGIWVPIYCLIISLSVYLITQTVEAMLFRFLLTSIPLIFCWRWAMKASPENAAQASLPVPAARLEPVK